MTHKEKVDSYAPKLDNFICDLVDETPHTEDGFYHIDEVLEICNKLVNKLRQESKVALNDKEILINWLNKYVDDDLSINNYTPSLDTEMFLRHFRYFVNVNLKDNR